MHKIEEKYVNYKNCRSALNIRRKFVHLIMETTNTIKLEVSPSISWALSKSSFDRSRNNLHNKVQKSNQWTIL